MNVKKLLLTTVLASVLCFGKPMFAACPSADLTGDCKVTLEDFAIMASQWMTEGTMAIEDIVWVHIDDPGFAGEMSKYETTNAQYCEFLNAAKTSGDVTVSGNSVAGASGSNEGQDFTDEPYYNLSGPGTNYNGATNGGAARIHWTGSTFTVDAGFENHPVTYVTWYGATAFAGYYGWRLPTEWEWQAAADYNGSYTYGCGTTINNSIANYYNSVHPHGTTPVGQFGTYGYGMADMAGNVWEWTSTVSSSNRAVRGGSWHYTDDGCNVSSRSNIPPNHTHHYYGFRVCR